MENKKIRINTYCARNKLKVNNLIKFFAKLGLKLQPRNYLHVIVLDFYKEQIADDNKKYKQKYLDELTNKNIIIHEGSNFDDIDYRIQRYHDYSSSKHDELYFKFVINKYIKYVARHDYDIVLLDDNLANLNLSTNEYYKYMEYYEKEVERVKRNKSK